MKSSKRPSIADQIARVHGDTVTQLASNERFLETHRPHTSVGRPRGSRTKPRPRLNVKDFPFKFRSEVIRERNEVDRLQKKLAAIKKALHTFAWVAEKRLEMAKLDVDKAHAKGRRSIARQVLARLS